MVQRAITTVHRTAREKELEEEISKLKQQLKGQEEKHNILEANLTQQLKAQEEKHKLLEAILNDKIKNVEGCVADLQRQTRLRDPSPLPLRRAEQEQSEPERKHPEVKKAVEIDESLNQLDRSGGFPLYGAAAGGHYDDVKRMLERGANPSMRTSFQWTALHWASGNGFPDVVRLLLEYGADVNAVSDTGKTPLQMAKTEEIRKMLLDKGAARKGVEMPSQYWGTGCGR